jgi:hypothetical protein
MMNHVGAPNRFFFEIPFYIVYRICTMKSGEVINGRAELCLKGLAPENKGVVEASHPGR